MTAGAALPETLYILHEVVLNMGLSPRRTWKGTPTDVGPLRVFWFECVSFGRAQFEGNPSGNDEANSP